MSSIMGLIGSELPELFALEFGKLAAFDVILSLASSDINQSTPNLVKMISRSKLSWIMGRTGQISQSYLPLIRKLSVFDIVYTLRSTNIDQPAPKLLKIYVILGLIGPKQRVLFALQLELLYLTLFTL